MAQRYSHTEKETFTLAGGSECSHGEKVPHKMFFYQEKEGSKMFFSKML